jgi:phytoene dehydrogenase-like protein
MSKSYDVIIIGAGPNGLATGAYLSRAGLKVLMLEKRYEAGGGLATEEVTFPGFFHNTHSAYHMMVDFAPPYSDFEMAEKYNVRYVWPDLQFVLPLSDGRAVCLYKDEARTRESFAQFSEKDAETYSRFKRQLDRYMNECLGPATYVPPVPALDQLQLLNQTELGREIVEQSEKTAQEIIEETFENTHIRALFLYGVAQWGIEYDQTGLGYMALIYFNRMTNYRFCIGGSHVVGSALNKIIHEHQGLVLNNIRIKRIIVEQGAATGVELQDGSVYTAAKAVVSSLDPHQTFLELVGKQNLSTSFAGRIERWEWESYSLFETHLALQHPPQFRAAESNPHINRAATYILGVETEEDVINHFNAIRRGELPPPAFNCCFSSVHDPSQAPKGNATCKISAEVPYALKGSSPERWYNLAFKDEYVDKCLALLERHAPNITADSVLWKYVITPLDIENRFADMGKGSIKQGAYIPLQMGYFRPNDECSENRTPIKNLYLCGSSCYPGGLVTFGPSYLAAGKIADDLGVQKWWSDPPSVVEARRNKML